MAYKGEIQPIVEMKEPAKVEPKLYKYKVHVHYADDRDNAIRAVLARDAQAVVRTIDGWRFRVKTQLTYAEIFNLLIQNKSVRLDTIRKAWWV